jgi:hypothetical protein
MTQALEQKAYVQKVRQIEQAIKKLPQTFIPVQHFFGHGIYTRIGFIPAGTLLTGKQHLKGQHNILVSGILRLAGPDGPVTLHAPEVIVSPPGTKRAGVALTDVVFATILATDDTTPEDVERHCIHPDDVDPSLLIGKEG